MLSVNVPKEITAYKEKIIFGMSLRQLICFGSAVLVSVGSYFLFTRVCGLTQDVTSDIIIVLAMPPLAIGFIRPHGMYFEKFLYLLLRQMLGRNKLPYQTELLIDFKGESDKNEFAQKNRTHKQKGRKKDEKRECAAIGSSKQSRKAKRAATRRKIKEAEKSYKEACLRTRA